MKRNRGTTGFKLHPLISRCSAGYTIIELMVTVAIFLILAAIIVYNWTSFMQYQDLRREAFNLHKELSSLKASALKDNSTFRVDFDSSAKSYSIYQVPSSGSPVLFRTQSFSNNVIFRNTVPSGISESCTAPDAWKTSGLTITPSNINAFTTGRIYLGSKGSNKGFCIQKGNNVINLQIYYWNGSVWKLM